MLKLYYHPLSSYCWKALIALYENDTPFEKVLVNFGDAESRDAFYALWPVGQFPVVKDETRDRLVPESSIIVEYLDDHYPGRTRFIPEDIDMAREVRMRDRFFDLHVHVHMQKITGNRIRPEGSKDPFGVEQARTRMATALGMVEESLGEGWAMGERYTLADIAASPALFYADKIKPLKDAYPKTNAYLERLKVRPSFARTLKEAEPYFHMFPQET
ncbi:MAG TPA: glutathione S-transferase family protein [Rhizomicrobium sp.]|nr:glutathione S-transferase family protein [Rhizomicrobium sp.]